MSTICSQVGKLLVGARKRAGCLISKTKMVLWEKRVGQGWGSDSSPHSGRDIHSSYHLDLCSSTWRLVQKKPHDVFILSNIESMLLYIFSKTQ